LSFQLIDDERYGRALKGCFLSDLGAGYGRSLTHIVEHDLAVDITDRVGASDTNFFEIYASHGF